MPKISMDHTRCGRCRRELSNDDSRARGYGPVCWGKIGGSQRDQTIMHSLPRTVLDTSQANAAFSELTRRALAAVADDVCQGCGEWLDSGEVSSYDHSGGIKLRGFQEPQWVYLRCKCGHQIAYHHIANLKYDDLELSWSEHPNKALAV